VPTARSGPVQWGISGTGKIAQLFARDFAHVRDGRVSAVASRDTARARRFAETLIPRFYGRYEDLVRDRAVDAVYVATPASAHKDNALLAVSEGIAVLCEKPLTVTGREAEDLINQARLNGTFLMEAVWTRCIPAIVRLREILAAGSIGEPVNLTADFGTDATFDSDGRLFSPELGGGATLQKGVFLVSLASMIFGPPNEVKCVGHVCGSGVDHEAGIVLGYPERRLAVLLCSLRTRTAREAVIVGTRGTIRIHSPVLCPSRLTITRHPDPGKVRSAAGQSLANRVKEGLIQHGKRSHVVRWAKEHLWALGESWVHGIRTKRVYALLIGEGLH
jgi:predicted dehydrogenase